MNTHSHLPLLPPEVLHLRIDLEPPARGRDASLKGSQNQAQAQAFDAIVAWCDAEQIFLGGSLAQAVVYAPLKPISPQQMQRLRRLILSQPGVAGCQMKLRLLTSLHLVAEKAASLEAFSQAQSYFAEKLVDGADALAGLIPAGPRSWRASATGKGTRLELQHEALQIWLAISRLDGQPIPDVVRFHAQRVSLSDVRMFVPDWLALHWTQLPQHPHADLSVGRVHGLPAIWLTLKAGNGTLA